MFQINNYSRKARRLSFLIIAAIIIMIGFGSPVYAEDTDAPPTDVICDPATDSTCKEPTLECGASGSGDCDMYAKYINPLINFLAAFVGIAATVGIVTGGVRYSMAGSDPGAIASARAIIRNSILALITFLFLYAIINWLQPGGIPGTI